jgi:DNA processing protein
VAAVTQGGQQVAEVDGRKYWVGFHRVPYIGPARIQRLLDRFETLEAAWTAAPDELGTVLDERSVESLIRTRSRLSLDREMERIARLGMEVVTLGEPSYPRLLAEIPSPPPVLYYKGSLAPEDVIAVAIVGTRRSTAYGRQVAQQLATELAEAGVTIVSGLARGIDGVAHRAAVQAGGRTLAVLGSGANVIYPAEHTALAEEIAAHGALISDYAPDTKPDAVNFPPRNRIIAGLSLGIVVVEAPSRSGALITCDFAADQGREVFVVPGSVLSSASAGCNRLLRDGARPVTCAADILEDLKLGQRVEQAAVRQVVPETEDERRLFAMLTAEPQHIDEVCAAANLAITQGSVLLSMMELKGFVRNVGAQHYVRA